MNTNSAIRFFISLFPEILKEYSGDTSFSLYALKMESKNQIRSILLILLTGFTQTFAFAQIGGTTVYNFLNLQPNARINALGGYGISIYENDVNLALQNPALLKPSMHNQGTINYVRFVSDIAAGYVGYGFSIDSMNTLSGGIQFVNYGNFTQTNENGEITGSFTASEQNIHLSYGRKTSDKVSIGGTLKFINSALSVYNSLGLAIDLGFNYYNPANLFSVSGVISNAGVQLTTYNDNKEKLPLNVMAGFSKKFLHNPLRISVVAHNLQNPGKLLYKNEARPGQSRDLESGNIVLDKITVFDKIAAHLNVSTEILLGKFMYVGFGYNHLRRYEMKLANSSGVAGFSWGFGLKFKKFQMAYGSAAYHAAYSTNSFSFLLFINEFSKSKK